MAEQVDGPAEVSQNLERLQDAFLFLENTLKILKAYPEGHQQTLEHMEELTGKLRAVAETSGDIWIDVGAKTLRVDGNVVYTEKEGGNGFVFAMYRDGVRQISFSPELTPEEIHQLMRILSAPLDAPEHFGEDTVTLLWEAGLSNFKTQVVDWLMEIEEGRTEQSEWEQLNNDYFEEMPELIAAAADSPTVDPEIAAKEKEEERQFKPRSPEAMPILDKDGLGRLRRDERPEDMLGKLVEIQFQELAEDREGPHRGNREPLELLFEALFRKEDLSQMAKVTGLLKRLVEEEPSCAEAITDLFQSVLSLGKRITFLMKTLLTDPDHAESARRLLDYLSPECAPKVLKAAEALSSDDAAVQAVALLSRLGAAAPEILVSNMEEASDEGKAMLIRALLELGSPEALELLAPFHKEMDEEARFSLLMKSQFSEAEPIRKMRMELLEDKQAVVRAKTEKLLMERGDPALVERLYKRLLSAEILGASFPEKRRLCTFLGKFGGKLERDALMDLVSAGTLLKGQDHSELAIAATQGLAASGNLDYGDFLKKRSKQRTLAGPVRKACASALERLHRTAEKRKEGS